MGPTATREICVASPETRNHARAEAQRRRDAEEDFDKSTDLSREQRGEYPCSGFEVVSPLRLSVLSERNERERGERFLRSFRLPHRQSYATSAGSNGRSGNSRDRTPPRRNPRRRRDRRTSSIGSAVVARHCSIWTSDRVTRVRQSIRRISLVWSTLSTVKTSLFLSAAA